MKLALKLSFAVLGVLILMSVASAATPREQLKQMAESFDMVFVKGGCFQMGDTFGDGYPNEKPVHEVCVDDFYIGKYEVTQKEWQKVMGNNPSYFAGCGGTCPVDTVSWNNIQEFIKKLNAKTGKVYRLPTEAEWEYAARSGGKREKYAGGDDVDSVAWYDGNAGEQTHPVGLKRPNGLDLYDMSGNVAEWVADWYDENYYRSSQRNNPLGAASGRDRTLCGGSWTYGPRTERTSTRYGFMADFRSDFTGFRLARTNLKK